MNGLMTQWYSSFSGSLHWLAYCVQFFSFWSHVPFIQSVWAGWHNFFCWSCYITEVTAGHHCLLNNIKKKYIVIWNLGSLANLLITKEIFQYLSQLISLYTVYNICNYVSFKVCKNIHYRTGHESLQNFIIILITYMYYMY